METQAWTNLNSISKFVKSVQKRKELTLLGGMDARLDYNEYLIRTRMQKSSQQRLLNKKRYKQLNKELVETLKSMQIQELINHFATTVEQISNLINQIYTPPALDNTSFLITEGWSRSFTLRIWRRKKLRFDRQKHIIYAEKDKKIKTYDLSNYTLRKSQNKDYFVIVLSAINSSTLDRSKLAHFGFDYQNTYQVWFKSIQQSIQYKQWHSFAQILNKTQQVQNYLENCKDFKKRQVVAIEPFLTKSQPLFSNIKNENEDTDSRPINSSKSILSIDQKNQFNQNFIKSGQNIQVATKISDQQILKSSFIYRLIQQQQLKLDAIEWQLQNQDQIVKKRKKELNFNKLLLPLYNFQDFQNIIGFKQILLNQSQIADQQSKLKIYQHQENPIKIKFQIISPILDFPHPKLHQCLDLMLVPNRNSQINSAIDESVTKLIISSENATIVHQKLAALNRLYRPRSFTFLRYLFQSNDNSKTFIIDRSLDQQKLIKQEKSIKKESSNYVEGDMNAVYCIYSVDRRIVIFGDLQINYKGQLQSSQSYQHTLTFIKKLFKGFNQQMNQDQIKIAPHHRLYRYIIPQIAAQDCQEQYQEENSVSQISVRDKKVSVRDKKPTIHVIPRQTYFSSDSTNQTQINLQFEYNQQKNQTRSSWKHYEPPKKPTKAHLRVTLPFLKEIQQQIYDWKTQIQPPWISDWAISQRGGLKYINSSKRDLNHQVKSIIQNLAKNTLSGKIIQNVNFPLQIFRPQSNLQTLLNSLSYAPSLFQNCHLHAFEKLKKCITFGLLISLLNLQLQKSFEPLLGETYQSQITNNCLGYAQQICVKPPLTALLLKSTSYTVSALVSPKIKILMNSVEGQLQGVFRVSQEAGMVIDFTLPKGTVQGIVFGEKRFILQGKSYYWIAESRIVLQLDFDIVNAFSPYREKTDYFQGTVYEVTSSFMSQFLQKRRKPSQNDIVRQIQKIEGNWTRQFKFENHNVDLRSISLYQMTAQAAPLLSDSSYRLDINELKKMNIVSAQKKKEELLIQQRKDRKLRQKYRN